MHSSLATCGVRPAPGRLTSAIVARPAPAERARETPPPGRGRVDLVLGSTCGQVPLQTHVLDFVEKRPVTDLQHLGRLDPVPPALFQRAADYLALGLQHRAPGDLLE